MLRILRASLFVSVFLFALACQSVEVLPEDKNMFVRGQDLSDYGVNVQSPEKYEKFSKTKYFDGSLEIEYEFEPPDSEEVMYMAQTITYEPKPSDAKWGRSAEDSLVGIALKAYGLETVEMPDFYRYGDSSKFYALRKDGRNVGNYFTVLEGGKVFSFLMAGVYFDDAETWRAVVEPKLQHFSAYKPE
jgi:hypothetical protein